MESFLNNLPPPPPPGVEVVLLVLVTVACYYDVRYRRIPNWATVTGALIGILLNTFLNPVVPGLKFALYGLGCAFVIYFGLYAIRAMSAGDVKLMAALGSLVGLPSWVLIWAVSAVIGAVLGLIVAAMRGRIRRTFWNLGFIVGEMRHGRPAYIAREELDVRSDKGLRMPHGLAVTVGTVLYLALRYLRG